MNGVLHTMFSFAGFLVIVRAYGKSDLFVTFTCNPTWPEIQNELLQGQTATDRPDLVARVFSLKLDAFKKDILNFQVLGGVQVISSV